MARQPTATARIIPRRASVVRFWDGGLSGGARAERRVVVKLVRVEVVVLIMRKGMVVLVAMVMLAQWTMEVVLRARGAPVERAPRYIPERCMWFVAVGNWSFPVVVGGFSCS